MSKTLLNFNQKLILKYINWKKSYKNIIKIQDRIVKQVEKKNFRKVRNLQRLLRKSFSAQLIISQKIIEKKSTKKYNIYKNIQTQLLKKWNIIDFTKNIDVESTNIFESKFFSHFHLICLLWNLAILPVLETESEHFSYNFRLYRTQHDFIYQLLEIINQTNSNWMLILKISSFFNQKNINWLNNNFIIEKKFLLFYLKSGLFNTNNKFEQKFSRHGKQILEPKISIQKILQSYSLQGLIYSSKSLKNALLFVQDKDLASLTNIPFFFYNNLVIIPSTNYNQLTNLKLIIQKIYKKRGLRLQKKWTWILPLKEGINFLGWNLKKNHDKVILRINRYNIKAHKLEIKRFLKITGNQPIDKVIDRLNQKIIHWQYYYAWALNSYQTWSEMNYYIFWRIWRWCKKRHKNKGSKWIYQRYWIKKKSQNWVFSVNDHSLISYSRIRPKIIWLPGSINVFKLKNYKTVYNVQVKKKYFFNH